MSSVKNLQQEFIVNYFQKSKCNFEGINKQVTDLYNCAIQKYIQVYNLKKIKEKESFAYTACYFVFKQHRLYNNIIQLQKIRNCISNIKMQRTLKVYYKLVQDYEPLVEDLKTVILLEDYSWLVYKILKNNSCLQLFKQIYPLYMDKFNKDSFNSQKQIETFVQNFITQRTLK